MGSRIGVSAVLCLLALWSVACGGATAAGEDGVVVGSKDAAPSETSEPPAEDTGSLPEDDTAPVETDTGAPSADAAPPAWSAELVALRAACGDTLDDVYRAPAPLPAMTDAARGDVVRCSDDVVLDLAAVKERISGVSDVDAKTGVRQIRIAFRTRKSDGSPTISTARVYLPLIPKTGAQPVFVAGHPSEGLADSCAPSKRDDTLKEIALPWAARGYALIAPDLPGLGNEGVHAYLDNRETGQAILDGARALRKLLKPGAFSSKVVLTGYSQGGGAVLAAQAMARAYGADGDVVAVAGFAPQYPTRIESFGLVDILENPDALTISHGYTNPVVTVLRTYGYFGNHGSDPGTGIPTTTRASIASSIESLCLIQFGGALQAKALNVHDYLDEELRVGLLACIASTTDAKCTGKARDYHAFLVENFLVADPQGAPILYVQGKLDTVMPIAKEGACNVAKLAKETAKLQVCTDGSTHSNVVHRNLAFGMAWVEALVEGKAVPTCSGEMPACN